MRYIVSLLKKLYQAEIAKADEKRLPISQSVVNIAKSIRAGHGWSVSEEFWHWSVWGYRLTNENRHINLSVSADDETQSMQVNGLNLNAAEECILHDAIWAFHKQREEARMSKTVMPNFTTDASLIG